MPDLTPLLRPEAERLAREEWEMCARIKHLAKPWLDVDPGGRQLLVDTHLALLLDLNRPASMDALARIVAGRVGLKVGATAPHWWRDWFHGAHEWSLGVNWTGHTSRVIFASEQGPHWNPDVARTYLRVVPGISALTSPAEALTRAALALSGASNG